MNFHFDVEMDQRSSDRKSKTFEQILNQADNPSIDWDQFQVNGNRSNSQKSDISNIFDKQKSQSFDIGNRDIHNISRDILQISYLKEKQGKSFRFENDIQNNNHQDSSRYERLSNLLAKAKQNSLSTFYKNIDRMNSQPITEQNFQTKQQFKDYINSIKESKKKAEEQFRLQTLKNKNKIEKAKDHKPLKPNVSSQTVNFDFSKKVPSNTFLPENFLNENFEEIEEENYKQPNEFDGVKQARQFFDSSGPSYLRKKQSNKKSKKQPIALDVIREQKPTIFQKTIQQEKLNLLINNYQDMRNNFDGLMTQLKQANNGQQKIVTEFKKIKEELNKKQRDQQKDKKKLQRYQSNQFKKQQFQQIKQEINKIKQSNKDLLFMKINQKIENLESAVKNALDQIAEQKQQPFVPKIVNYYVEEQLQERPISNAQFSEESIQKYRKQKQQFPININKLSKGYNESQNFSRSNVISPFQLANVSPQNYYQDQEIQFIPAQFAKQYFPEKIDTTNRNMRKSLTQKTSLVYQSFQFHVSAKFTLLDDDIHPLMAQLRVGNKCLINLSDVFVIVYGPQGFGPIVKPSNIYLDTFKHDTSFNFEVFLNKQCLDDNGFYIQISYKADVLAKKKVNIKVPIPLLRLIRPQFIYEEQFCQAWNVLENELYIAPKTLDFMHIRSHQDIKLILPFTHISESDPNIFSYGIMFRYPKSQSLFLMKLYCFINGKASVHLRTDKFTQAKIKEQILDVMNFLLFSP